MTKCGEVSLAVFEPVRVTSQRRDRVSSESSGSPAVWAATASEMDKLHPAALFLVFNRFIDKMLQLPFSCGNYFS